MNWKIFFIFVFGLPPLFFFLHCIACVFKVALGMWEEYVASLFFNRPNRNGALEVFLHVLPYFLVVIITEASLSPFM